MSQLISSQLKTAWLNFLQNLCTRLSLCLVQFRNLLILVLGSQESRHKIVWLHRQLQHTRKLSYESKNKCEFSASNFARKCQASVFLAQIIKPPCKVFFPKSLETVDIIFRNRLNARYLSDFGRQFLVIVVFAKIKKILRIRRNVSLVVFVTKLFL